MPLPDRIRLLHMLEAARKASTYASGKSRSALNEDELLSLGLTRLIEIIGEAAAGLSSEYKAAHPEIPWRQITGTRNRLIHGYFEVDLDILWNIIATDLPGLITELERLTSSTDEHP